MNDFTFDENPPDGQIYRRLRSYAGDQVAETKRTSLLSPYKRKYVHKLLEHKDSVSGLDSLLALPAVFNDGMRVGMIEEPLFAKV